MGTALKYHCDELYYNSKAINKLQKMLTTIKAKPISNICRVGGGSVPFYIILENGSHPTKPENNICYIP